MLPNVVMDDRAGTPSASRGPHQMDSLIVALGAGEQVESRRCASLAAEARRIARRRWVAEAVAVRSRRNDRGLAGEASEHLFERARRKTTRLSLGFHRAIESLWEAGGFDEALAIVRESKASPEPRARRIGAKPARPAN